MKTFMQDTSLEVYFNDVLPHINTSRGEVLKIFIDNPTMNFTNLEIARELRWDPNRVGPRVYELRGRDKRFKLVTPILIESERRICREGGRRSIAWQINPDMKPGGYKID